VRRSSHEPQELGIGLCEAKPVDHYSCLGHCLGGLRNHDFFIGNTDGGPNSANRSAFIMFSDSLPGIPSFNDVAVDSRAGVFLRENRVRSGRKVFNAPADQLTPVPHRFDLVNVPYLRGWVSIHNDHVC
jgi:hypothetical protein